ncbi:hypothetical protein ACG2LH_08680 [Zhouia sp. PK063]|uniref:hypothetical protein n=1 Tax=Zhouia sp. PK063 TaxID=3373602 RepID=UPI0037A93927
MTNYILKKSSLVMATMAIAGGLFTSCLPDEVNSGNGLTDSNVDAAFTITAVDGNANRFVLSSDAKDIIKNRWNIGSGFYDGKNPEEIFLPDAGTYTISHVAIGRGGAFSSTDQQVEVATSDPEAGNLVLGGKFENAEDDSKWTVLNISAANASWTFNDGNATVNVANQGHIGIYQPIQVEANKEYTVDMKVSGSGATNLWFEVYVSPTAPVQNQDYSAGGKLISLNTWDGCGNTSFDGKLSTISCSGPGNTVSFDQSGTVYLVIKCGGESSGSTGIAVTNVEFRGKPSSN